MPTSGVKIIKTAIDQRMYWGATTAKNQIYNHEETEVRLNSGTIWLNSESQNFTYPV